MIAYIWHLYRGLFVVSYMPTHKLWDLGCFSSMWSCDQPTCSWDWTHVVRDTQSFGGMMGTSLSCLKLLCSFLCPLHLVHCEVWCTELLMNCWSEAPKVKLGYIWLKIKLLCFYIHGFKHAVHPASIHIVFYLLQLNVAQFSGGASGVTKAGVILIFIVLSNQMIACPCKLVSARLPGKSLVGLQGPRLRLMQQTLSQTLQLHCSQILFLRCNDRTGWNYI